MTENEVKVYWRYYDIFNIEYDYIGQMFDDSNIDYDQYKLMLTIKRAYDAICRYTGYEGEYNPDYQMATISLAITYFQNDRVKFEMIKGNKPIKSITQGSRAVAYGENEIAIDDDGLTPDVRAMLPLPKLRVFG